MKLHPGRGTYARACAAEPRRSVWNGGSSDESADGASTKNTRVPAIQGAIFQGEGIAGIAAQRSIAAFPGSEHGDVLTRQTGNKI